VNVAIPLLAVDVFTDPSAPVNVHVVLLTVVLLFSASTFFIE